jgi:hypothetical protein
MLTWRLPRRPKLRRLLATNTWALKIETPNKFEDKAAEIGANHRLLQEH